MLIFKEVLHIRCKKQRERERERERHEKNTIESRAQEGHDDRANTNFIKNENSRQT
jgi:hypothetical protein